MGIIIIIHERMPKGRRKEGRPKLTWTEDTTQKRRERRLEDKDLGKQSWMENSNKFLK